MFSKYDVYTTVHVLLCIHECGAKVESKIRYSLIVSISTPDVSVDLYTPIVAQINNPIEVEIPTE